MPNIGHISESNAYHRAHILTKCLPPGTYPNQMSHIQINILYQTQVPITWHTSRSNITYQTQVFHIKIRYHISNSGAAYQNQIRHIKLKYISPSTYLNQVPHIKLKCLISKSNMPITRQITNKVSITGQITNKVSIIRANIQITLFL